MKRLLLIALLIVFACEDKKEEPLPLDCAGVEGGTAQLDNCGVCDTDLSNDCVPDCAGVWGGDALIDECGVCAGDGFSNGYYCRDLNVLQDFNDLNANLSGQPLEIGSQNWTDGRLDSLGLSGIGLTSIPESIGNLNSLFLLVLSDNQLTSLPDSLCSIYSNLTVFNININFLCGELPSCLIDVNIGEQDCP